MTFDEAMPTIRQILSIDFGDRDRDIASGVARIKDEMSGRGLMNSTITLRSLSEFFLAEFKARVDSIAERSLWAMRLTGAQDPGGDLPRGVALFRSIADEQFNHLLATHDGSASTVVASLQSNMPADLRNDMTERMSQHLARSLLAVELEYKAAAAAPSEVLALRPTIYGVGIDLKVLWKRFFK